MIIIGVKWLFIDYDLYTWQYEVIENIKYIFLKKRLKRVELDFRIFFLLNPENT